MITRIVHLHIHVDRMEEALEILERNIASIRQMDGCSQVNLFRDTHRSGLLMSISVWQSEAHLNNYRHSAFFQDFWKQLKGTFAEPARAWSFEALSS